MPVCELCDGEKFESRDGLFYCLTCGTQTQDIREEVAEADPELTLKNLKSAKKSSKAFERSSGKPWFMHEAFQIIIKKQLEFLIQIGVDARIKDIVGKIWFGYLKETGVAFCGKSAEPSLGYLKKGAVFQHNKNVVEGTAGRMKKRKQESEMDNDLLELSSQISLENSHQGEKSEDMDEDDDDDNDNDDDDDDDDHGDHGVSGGLLAGSDLLYSRRMSLRTTLAFSYLGLLFLDAPVFLSDILRWIKEGHFPYLEAPTLLPEYMKFTNQDSNILTSQVLPARKHILLDVAYITKLLNLHLPQKDLRKYTARFIMDLNLPAITHGFVNNLLREFPPEKAQLASQRPIMANSFRFEETAMAYILIALKMCYGFDDTQHELEENLAKPTEASESRGCLPVWKDWVSATRQCQAKRQASGIPWSFEEFRQTRNIENYTNFCKTKIFGSWSYRDPEMIEGRRSYLAPKKLGGRKEYRENFSEIFSNFFECSSTAEQPASTPSSFPSTCRHGNSSTNGEQDDNCFKDCFARGIPLGDLKHLCASSDSQSNRKYIKYLRQDVNGDTLHPSMRFLVGVMARRIDATTQELEFVIMKVEDAMIGVVKRERRVRKK